MGCAKCFGSLYGYDVRLAGDARLYGGIEGFEAMWKEADFGLEHVLLRGGEQELRFMKVDSGLVLWLRRYGIEQGVGKFLLQRM